MKAKLQALAVIGRRYGARLSPVLAPVGVGALSLYQQSANAALDLATTTADLGDAKSAVLSIGVAVLAVFVGIMLYKWIRRAL